jgi:hypothetical protein
MGFTAGVVDGRASCVTQGSFCFGNPWSGQEAKNTVFSPSHEKFQPLFQRVSEILLAPKFHAESFI